MNAYDTVYSSFDVYEIVRKLTYGSQDIGQSGWTTLREYEWASETMNLNRGSRVLDLGSGSGHPALWLAKRLNCRITGLDKSPNAIAHASSEAHRLNLDHLVHFEVGDLSGTLSYQNSTFDTVVSTDAFCHIPGRLHLLRECHRVLKLGGSLFFTDSMIVRGEIRTSEFSARSFFGDCSFVTPQMNADLLEALGFSLTACRDSSNDVTELSSSWLAARTSLKEEVFVIEGPERFEGMQKYLECVRQMSKENRLGRESYVAKKIR